MQNEKEKFKDIDGKGEELRERSAIRVVGFF